METVLDHPGDPLSIALAYLRFWAAMAFTVFWTVFSFFYAFVGLAIPDPVARRRWQCRAGNIWGTGILRVAHCPLEVKRLAPPPEGGFIYFSNHSSSLDILALFVALKDTPFVFAAKRELFKVPFIGWHLRLAGFVEVDRVHRDRAIQSYSRAARAIREGTVVTVFPEGTRSVDGSILPFKKGAFTMAVEAQRPVVPVAVDGAQHALRKHTWRLYGHPIRVVVGAPIETTGLGHDDRDQLLRRTRLAMLDLHRQAGAPESPLEPMIAPPGKPSGLR